MLKQLRHNVFFSISLALLCLLSACSQQTTKAPVSELSSNATQTADKKSPELLKLLQQLNKGNTTPSLIQRDTLLKQGSNSSEALALSNLITAKAELLNGQPAKAESIINSTDLEQSLTYNQAALYEGYNIQAEVLLAKQQPIKAAKVYHFMTPMLDNTQATQVEHQQKLWNTLSNADKNQITEQYQKEPDSGFKQWLNLLLLTQHSELVLNRQIEAINQWQYQNPTHPAALLPPEEIGVLRQALQKRPNNIAVLLPFDEKFKAVGQAIRDGIMASYYQSQYQPKISFYSATPDQEFLSLYNMAVEDGAQLIIGPIFKTQLESLYSLDSLPVTTIALNRSSNPEKPANLYEYSLSQDDEIKTLIEHMQKSELNNAVILQQKAAWADNAKDAFTTLWENDERSVVAQGSFKNNKEQSKVVQQTLNINNSKNRINRVKWALGSDIQAEPRRRQDIDTVLLLSKPSLAASLRPLLSFYYINKEPLFSTSSVYRGYDNQSKDRDLNRIQFSAMPLVVSHQSPEKYARSKLISMYAFGRDAFLLAERIHLMSALPTLRLSGATGNLSLDEQYISRQLSMAKFIGGQAVLLESIEQQSNDAKQ